MSDCGTLRVTVSDEGGTLLPCRLHIKLADGTCYLPPEDATAGYSETAAPELLLPPRAAMDQFMRDDDRGVPAGRADEEDRHEAVHCPEVLGGEEVRE